MRTPLQLYPNLKEKWFYYFVALSKYKSLSATAKYLGITVPSLSQNLRELEAKLKTPLIERAAPQLTLTPEGAVFLKLALELVEQLQNLQADFTSESELEPLSIGWCNSWFPALFPSLMRQLYAEKPNLYPRIQCCHVTQLESGVREGQFQLGMFNQAPESPELGFFRGPAIPFVIVAVPPLGKAWQDLKFANYTGLIPSWDDHRYPRKIVFEGEEPSVILDLCLNTGCAAYLPAYLVAPLVRSKRLEVVAEPPEAHWIEPYVIWKKDPELDPLAVRTLDLIQKLLFREFAL